MKTLILAGGRGQRLAPYTSVLPKPLMPLGDRAILEVVLAYLRAQGFDDVTLSVGHLSHLIRAVLQGRDAGVHLDFVEEEVPLGTAGPLKLVPDLGQTSLVMNGDVLTTLDLHDLVEQHRRSGDVLTIASHRRRTKVDFGILDVDTAASNGSTPVRGYDEKPELDLVVSMGIYVVEREVVDVIPDGYFDFPDLVLRLLEREMPVGAYLYDGYWLDIGRPDDYAAAIAAWNGDGDSAAALARLREPPVDRV